MDQRTVLGDVLLWRLKSRRWLAEVSQCGPGRSTVSRVTVASLGGRRDSVGKTHRGTRSAKPGRVRDARGAGGGPSAAPLVRLASVDGAGTASPVSGLGFHHVQASEWEFR